jgi:WD40 repeat protein
MVLGAVLVIAGIVFAIFMADQSSTNNDGGYQFPIDTVAPYDPGVAYPTAAAIDTPNVTGGSADMTLFATGSLHDPRAFQTATLLRDGTVLIAGGTDGTKALSTAEIYHPASGTFAKTSQMSTPRLHGTATLLSDGKVLIAGGEDAAGTVLASAEIFDPATGSFTPTGDMSTPRRDAAAAVLADGRVLIVGGNDGSATPASAILASAEIYNPFSGVFTLTGRMSTPREGMTATPLGGDQTGAVLVAGGTGPDGPLGSSENYDPSSGIFGAPEDMGSLRADPTACRLPSGDVLLVGGHGTDQSADSPALIYHTYFAWTSTTSLNDGRTFGAAATLPNGLVLVAGGLDHAGKYLSAVDVYNSQSSITSFVGDLKHSLAGLTATTLQDGSVLIAGGEDSPVSAVPEAMIYGPAAIPTSAAPTTSAAGGLTLVSAWSLAQPRALHTATLLQDGRVLIAGGRDDTDTTLATAEVYEPATGSFTQTGPMSSARIRDTATLLPDGRVLISGGKDATGQVLATAELFDPKTGDFIKTGSMSTPRFNAKAVALADGRVLIVGGNDGSKPLDTLETYDPKSGKFSSAGRMSVPRDDPAVAVLGGAKTGKVIIAGGADQFYTAEVYDPVSGVSGLPEDTGTALGGGTACTLADGSVLFIGDDSIEADDPIIEYSVSQDAWTTGPTIEAGGSAAAVAPLEDGSILVVESISSGGVTSNFVDVYDPTTARVDYVGGLAQGRDSLTATQLKDGSILFVGGEQIDGPAVGTVELYKLSR